MWNNKVRCVCIILLYVAFLVWAEAPWGVLVIPFIFDAYITKKINWGWWRDLEDPWARFVMSWVDAIVFALTAVYFINIYFFQNYTIPSSSLEKSLLVGDYLFVSKMSYGPRIPQTPLHAPLCQHTLPWGGKSYVEWIKWDYKRVRPKAVNRGDIVVFNYPANDTSLTEPAYAERDYIMMCYNLGTERVKQMGAIPDMDALTALERYRIYEAYYAIGREIITSNPREFGNVIVRPVDRRENYVKRCVGLPGQTLEIRERDIYIDGKRTEQPKNVQFMYYVEWRLRPDKNDPVIREAGISYDDLYGQGRNPDNAAPMEILPLTQEGKEILEKRADLVASVTLVTSRETDSTFPQNGHYGWTIDNYGPIWIPKRGESVELTLENLPLYERAIRAYEGHSLKVSDEGKIIIDGKETKKYTFSMDYYWMMGDNRHNSLDSRYWGFVPEDHIVGKPVFVWLSKDKDYPMFHPRHYRWNRMFRWVESVEDI